MVLEPSADHRRGCRNYTAARQLVLEDPEPLFHSGLHRPSQVLEVSLQNECKKAPSCVRCELRFVDRINRNELIYRQVRFVDNQGLEIAKVATGVTLHTPRGYDFADRFPRGVRPAAPAPAR
jgi:hypothetical protein